MMPRERPSGLEALRSLEQSGPQSDLSRDPLRGWNNASYGDEDCSKEGRGGC